MTPLKGRHALVTGGGRGIGRAIAASLVEAGATVTVVGREPRSRSIRPIAEGDAHAAAVADVTDAQAVQRGRSGGRRALRAGRSDDRQCRRRPPPRRS